MKRTVIFVGTIIIWLGTLLLLLPCTGVSCAFALWSMNASKLPFHLPFDAVTGDLIFMLSYYISLISMLIASGMVVLVAEHRTQVLKRMLVIDSVVLVILLPLWYNAVSFLPR